MNSVYLPPLRERKGDIPLLAYHFLKRFCVVNEKKIDKISDAAMKPLTHHDYPGNVRELMNVMNSAVIIESTNEIRKKSLPNYFLESATNLDEGFTNLPLKSMADVEKDHIRKILGYTDGNKSKAAQILGISRITLLAKVKKYKLE